MCILLCCTHSSQHDADNEPSEAPDADERGGAAAGDLRECPHRTQKNGQKASFQELTLPTWTTNKSTVSCFQVRIRHWVSLSQVTGEGKKAHEESKVEEHREFQVKTMITVGSFEPVALFPYKHLSNILKRNYYIIWSEGPEEEKKYTFKCSIQEG